MMQVVESLVENGAAAAPTPRQRSVMRQLTAVGCFVPLALRFTDLHVLDPCARSMC